MLKTPATAGTARENGNHHRRMIAVNNSTCSVSECSNKVVARGWCSKHYQRWKIHGDPEYVGYPSVCSVEGCHAAGKITRGLCSRHYWHLLHNGDPLGGQNKTRFNSPEESFTARTEWQGRCLVWTGSKNPQGYGLIWNGDKLVLSHRYAWERVNGPIPEGMHLDHKNHCNTACCNPEHLRLATRHQNMANRSGRSLKNKSSGVRNVYPRNGRWRVIVVKHHIKNHFGTYDTIEEAAEVAERARKELFGNYAGRG